MLPLCWKMCSSVRPHRPTDVPFDCTKVKLEPAAGVPDASDTAAPKMTIFGLEPETRPSCAHPLSKLLPALPELLYAADPSSRGLLVPKPVYSTATAPAGEMLPVEGPVNVTVTVS